MHLKSLTLKGFKSFPDRTRLDFGPGVSVVVGPNGSGKSNVTDAVLWAMGEQSPLAVRGQSMQDVIFGGGRGVQARSSAEVEIVLDNSDGSVALPVGEISILRRLDRSGEGEYRLNGARCRLGDVIEVLSDTGLGKETHSVISQGRVEAIVTSKPRDRRMLIEEAAGLGKHRKRRRRAQLKLGRTQENLDRALDVEREARSRLRPLKRQAEAAELHERLERQMLEARLALVGDALRRRRAELGEAEARAQAAREAREAVEGELATVVERRGVAERALTERSERHDRLAGRVLQARSAGERLQLRREQALAMAETLAGRRARAEREMVELREALGAAAAGGTGGTHERIAALEQQLEELERERRDELERELAELERSREKAAAEVGARAQALADTQRVRAEADAEAEAARAELRAAERDVEAARREAARVGAELAAANQFLRSHSRPRLAGGRSRQGGRAGEEKQPGQAPVALNELLKVQPGYELALAAVLGPRLDAALVADLGAAGILLDDAGHDGATALLAGADRSAEGGELVAIPAAREAPPAAGARALATLVQVPARLLGLASGLLAGAWVVERLEDLPADFAGIGVTAAGRVWFASAGEVRQVAEGGAERVLARRNERDELLAATETCAAAEHAARAAASGAAERAQAAEAMREQAEGRLREANREHARALERERQAEWLMEQRRAAPEQGALAVRRAELQGELAAERRQAERLRREHEERVRRLDRLRAQHGADTALAPVARRLADALQQAAEAVAKRVAELDAELARHSAAGEQMAGELRACAAREAELQARLRAEGEAVTAAEVAAQRLRDQAAEAELELRTVRERLQRPVQEAAEDPEDPKPGEREAAEEQAAEERRVEAQEIEPDAEPLSQEEIGSLAARVERLRRRREQLGPVNPLAQQEYAQALAHVEELEERRVDLETALRELRAVIRETDRQIQETFQATFTAAARNFEELAGDVFPGGSGRLVLVKDLLAPRSVLGGEPAPAEREGEADPADAEAAEQAADAEAQAQEQEREQGEEELLGVEIEITPAGKSTKRLSLLSGGEKSMTALAFLFAVFLARPCPFYIMDEVEAALDDLNLDRFLRLLRRYADRAQFIVITHQKRTMEAADWLYGVSMAGNGVSKVLSRKLPAPAGEMAEVSEAA
ncbi:MAG TPA: AAA family ATPase [Solirubrobacteraceae bacterium]|nr:AAA family ATPase [Solirubrobacteraceae bacterium]